jgi:sugar phosphate isomerase/epimerase
MVLQHAPGMNANLSRRAFLVQGVVAVGTVAMAPRMLPAEPTFKISLAEWSLHRALRAGKLTNLDFPKVAKQEFGLDAVEYVNQFFKDQARDDAYLNQLKSVCDGEGVRSLLIMCDGEGQLGDPDEGKRRQAVENHHKWVQAAKRLGCHSIRVNAATGGQGSFEEQQKRAADGLRALSEYAAPLGVNVIVENHGGLSSNGAWLAGVMKQVALPNCGTLPDFGNFRVAPGEDYDLYQGIRELMPFARGVSAKSYDFDEAGNETKVDYTRILKIVLEAGYHGYVGIEYEGSRLDEYEGVRATKRLLERVRAGLG